MKKLIRWPGLIGFAAVTGLAALLWLVFVDRWARSAVEAAGSLAVGAEVNVSGADVTLFPAGLTLTKVEFTDPETPTENAVEFAKMACTFDALELLRRKVIVKEMAVEGMRFGTTREHPGKLGRDFPGKEAVERLSKSEASKVEFPSFEVPDAKKVLESENLESLKIAEDAKAKIAKERETWKQRLGELPNEEKFAEYKEKIAGAQKSAKGGVSGALRSLGAAKDIKDQITKDINAIKKAKSDLEAQIADAKATLEKVKRAPFEDIERIKKKYGLSPEGLANLAGAFLGPKIEARVRQILLWRARLEPLLKGKKKDGPQVEKPLRGKGHDVHFKEFHPLPGFLLEKAKVSLTVSAGDFSGEIVDVTNEPEVLGRPIQARFEGSKLEGMGQLVANFSADRTKPQKPKDRIEMQAQGYALPAGPLSDSPDFPLELKKGRADFEVQGTLSGDLVDLRIGAKLAQLALSGGPKRQNAIAKTVAGALSKIDGARIQARIKGPVEAFKVDLTTDMDRVFKDAASGAMGDLAKDFERQLKAQIDAKMAGPLKDLEAQLGGFDSVSKDLTSRLNAGSSALTGGGAGGAVPTPKKMKLPF